MMDEERILNGIFADNSVVPRTMPDYVRYNKLKMLTDKKELEKIELKSDGDFELFNTHLDILDSFLNEKFELSVYEFMKIYTEKHVQNGFSFPITTPYVTCVFKKESDPIGLAGFLKDYHAVYPSDGLGLGVPNLHDGTIYVFTLIEADFDVSKFSNAFPGHYYKGITGSMNVSSSHQFDITVVYEAPKQS